MELRPFVDKPIGGDPELNEAIKVILSASGFETESQEAIKLVELALRKKLEQIAARAHFHAGADEEDNGKLLNLQKLKQALSDEKIAIDRPEFILEQPQSKMSTRRSKGGK